MSEKPFGSRGGKTSVTAGLAAMLAADPRLGPASDEQAVLDPASDGEHLDAGLR